MHSGGERRKLVDDDQRKRLLEGVGRNMVAVAGAGTGKTRSIVGRVLAALKKGMRPGELFITTFTEKAAAEIQERILDELAKEDDGGLLREMEESPASTFHAKALALLETFSVEAGLHPGMSVFDADAEERFYGEVFRLFMARALEDGSLDADCAALLAGVNIGPRRLEAAAAAYARMRSRAPGKPLEEALGSWPGPNELKKTATDTA
ncbi:MAG TPA: hypothetical protein ENN09_01375, partial [Planctomycetes bacterium]|nr:hypothetical protein [Planctomycetota bacterium]